MKKSNDIQDVLSATMDSVVGYETDLRFDIIDFLNENLQSDQMTQKELASKLKMKESQLCRIICGDENLTLKTIARIFHVFNIKPQIAERKDDISQIVGSPTEYSQFVINESELKFKSSQVGNNA
jgi:transcriptional regulator with XRE-family HTH domain